MLENKREIKRNNVSCVSNNNYYDANFSGSNNFSN